MSDFSTASHVERTGDAKFVGHFTEDWMQGRGPFGGLVLGMLLRAMQAEEPDATRRVRTVSGDLCAPGLPGPAEITVRVLRRGAHQTNLSAELQQAGEVRATATAILSHARPQPVAPLFETPPPAGDWEQAPVLPVGPPVAPVFTPHYEYRSDTHTMHSITTVAPSVLGWIREREPLGALDAPALIARLDAWWPSLFAIEGHPRPVVTVSFLAQLYCDPAELVAKEPLRYRARVAAMYEGFFLELRELWQGERVVALNQQTFAIVK